MRMESVRGGVSGREKDEWRSDGVKGGVVWCGKVGGGGRGKCGSDRVAVLLHEADLRVPVTRVTYVWLCLITCHGGMPKIAAYLLDEKCKF